MKTQSLLMAAFMMAGLVSGKTQGTGFTYQGRLNDGAKSADGIYDLRFTIFDSSGGPGIVAGPLTKSPVGVTNGLFTSVLDPGTGVFTGADRWLEIGVRTNGGGAFTALSPRQKLTPTPYAIFAPNAGTAASAASVAANAVGPGALQASAVTSAKIADGTVTVADVNAATFSSTFWKTDGNAGTMPGAHFLGTSDDRPLELRANGLRALRLEPGGTNAPNVVGGFGGNSVLPGFEGAVIAGGGLAGFSNTLAASYSSIGGGAKNLVEGSFSAIGAGINNLIRSNANSSVLGGGNGNLISIDAGTSVLAGGFQNVIGTNADGAVIGGGWLNQIPGNALYAVVGGGRGNVAGGLYSVVPGGRDNTASGDYSVAVGRRAKPLHAGAMVLADATDADVSSTTTNELTIRASGGVRVLAGTAGILLNGQPVLSGLVSNTSIADASVTSAKIADGTVTAADVNSASFSNTFWNVGGNAGTRVETHFLGTTDNEPLEVKVNNSRVLRLEPTLGGNPNIIGGAANNVVGVGATSATIAGGKFNGIGQYTLDCVVGGGSGNAIGNDAIRSAIAGGYNNVIGTDASYSTIGGGYNNAIGPNAEYSWLGGGRNNTIRTNSANATLAGGAWNSIGTNTSSCVIGGGTLNEIPANAASATIPGGSQNFATSMAFAAGHRAKANHTGAFVWADSQFPDFASTAANQFLIRAAGGVGIGTTAPDAPLHVQSGAVGVTLNSRAVLGLERVGDTWLQMITTTSNHAALIFGSPNDSLDASLRYNNLGGRELAFRTLQSTRMVILTNGNVGIGNTGPSDRFMVANARCDGSSWINASDRRLKQGFAPVDAQAVLEKVAALPLQQWSYKAQPDQKHLGPMAQDFRAAFGLGADDTSIATVDADGVALAAVQGLNQKLTEELKRQDTENAQLKARLERLEKLLIHRTPTEPQTEISP